MTGYSSSFHSVRAALFEHPLKIIFNSRRALLSRVTRWTSFFYCSCSVFSWNNNCFPSTREEEWRDGSCPLTAANGLIPSDIQWLTFFFCSGLISGKSLIPYSWRWSFNIRINKKKKTKRQTNSGEKKDKKTGDGCGFISWNPICATCEIWSRNCKNCSSNI